MRLTISAIIDNLPAHLAPQVVGVQSEQVLLGRPELYGGRERSFLSGISYAVGRGELRDRKHGFSGGSTRNLVLRRSFQSSAFQNLPYRRNGL